MYSYVCVARLCVYMYIGAFVICIPLAGCTEDLRALFSFDMSQTFLHAFLDVIYQWALCLSHSS